MWCRGWPRIFPKGGIEGETPNEEGLKFYERVFTLCRKHGIELLVTIFHFENPAYLTDHYDGWHGTDAQTRYQATHHLFVANALAVKLGHEINPVFKIGSMLSLSGVYPESCKPEDVMGTVDFRRRALFFSDVMMRGEYPAYAPAFFRRIGVNIRMEAQDEELIRKYIADFLAFSYYRTTVYHYGLPERADTGGQMGVKNHYLKESP